MVPIVVFWTEYTATIRGSVFKLVPCENCSTEYVYKIEREGSGTGTSIYMLNDEGAAGHAESAAEDTLQSALDNDFDPVPCPACGHYQRYMFPKLLEAKGTWVNPVMLMVFLIGCLATVIALFRSVAYLQGPSDYAFGKMVTRWSVVLALCLLGLGLTLVKRHKIRHFDPNREDQQARIAKGRSRAVTRAEFERAQQGAGDQCPPSS